MPDPTGTIKSIYSDEDKQNLIFPRTKVNAISDANGNSLSSLLNAKQDTLVSGTNIKTINSTSLLGSGDIVITSGDTNVIETVKVNNTALPVSNKAVNIDLSGYATTSALSNKQDTLVSGTNIKTINNTSLLGSGNIDLMYKPGDTITFDKYAQFPCGSGGSGTKFYFTIPLSKLIASDVSGVSSTKLLLFVYGPNGRAFPKTDVIADANYTVVLSLNKAINSIICEISGFSGLVNNASFIAEIDTTSNFTFS